MPLPVDAQGCAGGKCGVTTTLTPSSGPTGSQVTVSISSGAYPLDGKYEIWWSKSPTMSDDPTTVKLGEGWNERLKQSISLTISVPEATSGTNYFHYIKAGRTEQMLNFAFQVTPTIIIKNDQMAPRSTSTLVGTGFSATDDISLFIDGEPLAVNTEIKTDKIGSFSSDIPIPDLASGTHVIKATAKKMYNQEATTRFKLAASIKVEPSIPVVGKTATVTGYGFSANTDVSIKYDFAVVTASPTSDKTGGFIYNFTVPETSETKHTVTATDKNGNTATWELPVESNPPSTPTPISPTSDRLGIMGTQAVTFTWMPSKDDSGVALYTLEVADNMNFFPLMPGMRRSNLTDPSVSMNIEPGTYYWRVQAVDPSGNKSKWALSPYAFQVGLVNLWVVVGASLILLVIFIFLLRAFIQRVRGYYY
ncbi:MAG: hypothetical protein NTZ34_03260 [Chloroflexi bacterium]|nr:hypothetical protein [Chloroflexota bacterium]